MHIDTDNIKTDKELQALVSALQGLRGQVLYCGNVDIPTFNGAHVDRYTFKRKPKFRPWTVEEGLGKKIRWKDNHNNSYLIMGYKKSSGFMIQSIDSHYYPASILLDRCIQLDGSPCGTMEEG